MFSNCKRCRYRHGCCQFDCINLLHLIYYLIISHLKPSNNLNFQVWRCAPIAKGVGFGMVVLSLIVSIYYNQTEDNDANADVFCDWRTSPNLSFGLHLFQKLPKTSKSKQTQFKTPEDHVKTCETNCNVFFLNKK